jgi:hypothetical protein
VSFTPIRPMSASEHADVGGLVATSGTPPLAIPSDLGLPRRPAYRRAHDRW